MRLLTGIQGGEGSYHEQAAMQMNPGRNARDIRYFKTFPELFKALMAKEVGTIVCATENTRVGKIAESNAELAAIEGRYRQTGDSLLLPIRHLLLGVQGASLEDVSRVYSQQPALNQCVKFLANKLPGADLVARDDTALSALYVAEAGDPANAAIASAAACVRYKLQPLCFDIQDDPKNATRFIEIALN